MGYTDDLQRGYQRIQETKPVTLGYALHDSPVGMLAWFVGKLRAWTDDYPWEKDELINWAFIHYQHGPSASMQIYKEAEAVLNENGTSMLGRYIHQPVGGSLFPKEVSDVLFGHKWLFWLICFLALVISSRMGGGGMQCPILAPA